MDDRSRFHGLVTIPKFAPLANETAISPDEAAALTHEIVGTEANPEIQQLAPRLAEAHIDLCRVRRARHQLLYRALSNPDYESRRNSRDKIAALCALLRPNAPDVSMEELSAFLPLTPQGAEKFATILSEEA